MFQSLKIKLINEHIIIEGEQTLLLDTGSPASFHAAGSIRWGGDDIPVFTSVSSVSKEYIHANVGVNVDGLVGMDIIHRYSVVISLRDNMLLVDDDTSYPRSFKCVGLGPLAQGLIGIEMSVNRRAVGMIVDTGAPISYINRAVVAGMTSEREVRDFHPLIGDYKTNTYRCEVAHINDDVPYCQEFGLLPNLLEATLSMINVDGIIGVDLFKRYRIQIKDGKLFFPPQGI